jgi:hypothetical protein
LLDPIHKLKELGCDSKDSMRLYYHNKAVMNNTYNSIQHNRTKHVKIDKHFTKEKLCAGVICTQFVKIGE